MENITTLFNAIQTADIDVINTCLSPNFTYFHEASGTTLDRAAFCQAVLDLHATFGTVDIVLGDVATAGAAVVANVSLVGIVDAAVDLVPELAASIGPGGELSAAFQPWTFNVVDSLFSTCRAAPVDGLGFADVLALIGQPNLVA